MPDAEYTSKQNKVPPAKVAPWSQLVAEKYSVSGPNKDTAPFHCKEGHRGKRQKPDQDPTGGIARVYSVHLSPSPATVICIAVIGRCGPSGKGAGANRGAASVFPDRHVAVGEQMRMTAMVGERICDISAVALYGDIKKAVGS